MLYLMNRLVGLGDVGMDSRHYCSYVDLDIHYCKHRSCDTMGMLLYPLVDGCGDIDGIDGVLEILELVVVEFVGVVLMVGEVRMLCVDLVE